MRVSAVNLGEFGWLVNGLRARIHCNTSIQAVVTPNLCSPDPKHPWKNFDLSQWVTLGLFHTTTCATPFLGHQVSRVLEMCAGCGLWTRHGGLWAGPVISWCNDLQYHHHRAIGPNKRFCSCLNGRQGKTKWVVRDSNWFQRVTAKIKLYTLSCLFDFCCCFAHCHVFSISLQNYLGYAWYFVHVCSSTV